MEEINLRFEEIGYSFPFAFVKGTGDRHFLFGLENDLLKVRAKDFFISRYPVTQLLWKHIMGSNPAISKNDNKPVENVSYDELVADAGFLQKINATCREQVSNQIAQNSPAQFRLPTETEWEYAARGGIHWGDYFVYSGGNNIDELGWYGRIGGDESKPVGLKKPNQLGLYDMSGNVWEWCQDYYHEDTTKIPLDGAPCPEPADTRVLRGGCFHNYAMHCTVMKRYAIEPQSKDPCIGLRLVLAATWPEKFEFQPVAAQPAP
jgi:sulfatase modifying factor 1